MGLFNKSKPIEKTADWSQAYNAGPKFYETPDGKPLGVFTITEDLETILPKAPHKKYRVDGRAIKNWRLALVSTEKKSMIGEVDYLQTIKSLEKFASDSTKDAILIRPLVPDELESLLS